MNDAADYLEREVLHLYQPGSAGACAVAAAAAHLRSVPDECRELLFEADAMLGLGVDTDSEWGLWRKRLVALTTVSRDSETP